MKKLFLGLCFSLLYMNPAFSQLLVGQNLALSTSQESKTLPNVAANTTDGSFLVVWGESKQISTQPPAYDMRTYGRLVDTNGVFLTSPINLTPATEAGSSQSGWGHVFYNSQDNEFLLVFVGSTSSWIFMQRISTDGIPVGVEIPLCKVGCPPIQSLGYDSSTNQFLSVWRDDTPTGLGIVYGQLINATELTLGPLLTFSMGLIGPGNPKVVFNPAASEYLVLFDASTDTVTDIFGQRVSASGDFVGPRLQITHAPELQAFPQLSLNTTTNQYLAIWSDQRDKSNSGEHIYGKVLNVNGTFDSGDIWLDIDDSFEEFSCNFSPRATYDAIYNRYLVSTISPCGGGPGSFFLKGRMFSASLQPVSASFNLSHNGDISMQGTTAVLTRDSHALLIWSNEPFNPYAQVVDLSTELTYLDTSLTAVPNVVSLNRSITFNASISNTGSASATAVKWVMTLPPSAVFVNAQSSAGTCSELNGTVECAIGDVATGSNVNITISAQAPGTMGDIQAKSFVYWDNGPTDAIPSQSNAIVHASVYNTAPVGNAGPDQTVNAGTIITLNGSGSNDPDNGPASLSYSWSQTSGPAVALKGDTVAQPSFIPLKAGVYVFSLVVNDGNLSSSPNEVVVTVNDSNLVDIQSPNGGEVWNENSSQMISWLTTQVDSSQRMQLYLSLDGGLNWKLIASPRNLGYKTWKIPRNRYVAKQAVLKACVKNDPTSCDISDGVFTINDRPVAEAGVKQRVLTGSQVILNGGGSYDLDQGPIDLDYHWTQVSGPVPVELNGAETKILSFTPSVKGLYKFSLIVNDGAMDSKIDRVSVRVVDAL